jgi:hypothetical protein
VRPLLELLGGRQLTVQQQVGDLEEGRVLGELLDRVAPVLEDAGVTVDVGDRAAAGRGVDEPRVVGRQARLAVDGDLLEICGPDGPIRDRYLELAPGPVVANGERISHGDNLAVRARG